MASHQLGNVERTRKNVYLILPFPMTIRSVLEVPRIFFAFRADAVIVSRHPRALNGGTFDPAIPQHLGHTRPSMATAHIAAVLHVNLSVCHNVIIQRAGSPSVMRTNIGIGLLLSFSYILFSTVTSTFAVSGATSPLLAMWIPNIIYTVIAVVLYKKAPK